MKDGWHTIASHELYVEDGYIIRGIKYPYGQSQPVPAYVYRRIGGGMGMGGWGKEDKITPDAFRAGVKRGTIDLM